MRSADEPSADDPAKDHQLVSRYGHADDAIVTHNTLSADVTHVQVCYPFHPLYGYSLRVLRRPKRGDGAVLVLDSAGKRSKIPVWMLLSSANDIIVTEQARLSKESLLGVTLLFEQWNASGNSDNLLQPSVDGGKEGHHAAAATVGSKPNRRGTRACRGDDTNRVDPTHGAHSGDGLPNRTQESE
jgi:hypothetical protein